MDLLKRNPNFWKARYEFWNNKIAEDLVTKIDHPSGPSGPSGPASANSPIETVSTIQATGSVDLKNNKEVQELIRQAVAQALKDSKTPDINGTFTPFINSGSSAPKGDSTTQLENGILTMLLDVKQNYNKDITIYPFGNKQIKLPKESYNIVVNFRPPNHVSSTNENSKTEEIEIHATLKEANNLYIIPLGPLELLAPHGIPGNGIKPGWILTVYHNLK